MKNRFLNFVIDLFKYNPEVEYQFSLSNDNAQNNFNEIKPLQDLNTNIFPLIDANLEYVKNRFNFNINSDIKIREFDLNFRNRKYKSFILYIDGMCNTQNINRFVLHPLMLRINRNTSDNYEQQKFSNSDFSKINHRYT